MNALLSVVTGVLQNCVALVADSFAQFAGVISLAIGLVAIRVSSPQCIEQDVRSIVRFARKRLKCNHSHTGTLAFDIERQCLWSNSIRGQLDLPSYRIFFEMLSHGGGNK